MKIKHCNFVNRTRDSSFKYLMMLLIAMIYFCRQINAKNLVNINDVHIETQFKMMRISGIELHQCDNIQIRATFSPFSCDANNTKLEYIQCVNYFYNRNSLADINVSLKNFNFKNYSMAYLCIRFDDQMKFTHLGNRSSFSRLKIGQKLKRNQRNAFESTRGDNKCRADGIRIDGMRIESSSQSISYDDNNVPELISQSKATLRLFGCGFTEQTIITFTQHANNRNEGCLSPSSGQFKVRSDELFEYTALVDIAVPYAEKTYHYFCVRNVDINSINSDATPFIHQGTDAWLRIISKDALVPVWVAIIIIILCLCFSALFSGLNLGLLALDRTELKILCNTGNATERVYAKKIQPIRDQGNFLLCSLLLGNVLVNSLCTILLDGLTSGLTAVISSTLLIVIIGEITPQAICSRHGLAVGAHTIYATKAIMILTFPLSYPTSKILDWVLGEEIGNVYNRERLKELLWVTKDINDLDRDEVNIISGTLELRKKTVAEIMTPLDHVFMLSVDAILNFETVSEITKCGYSRIPVYENERYKVVQILFIKDLALIDPDDNTPVRTVCDFYQNQCFFVFEDTTLDVMFRQFKCGHKGHMAFVQRVNNDGDGDPFYETIGIVTLEDVIEEMIQAEIVDEKDVYNIRDHDFTAFALRREDQHIRISPQLTLATFQFLSTTIDAFKPNNVSETILRRLLNQDVVHHIQLKDKNKNNLSRIIYQQGKPADYFVLILEGHVEVTVGLENLLFECGPFTYFGTQALTPNVVLAEQEKHDSLQSLILESKINPEFIPDYTVRAITDVFYIQINRNLYLAAKRATLMHKVQRSFDIESHHSDEDMEKLMQSLDGEIQFRKKSSNTKKTENNRKLSNSSTPEMTSIGKELQEAEFLLSK